MGNHEPMTAKAIANKIKAKGLQKIKYYCEMCKKQCRDDNGFKCHIQSESHQRQALIVSENPEQFVNEFSKEFMDGFMFILKTHYKTKKILANTVFQEYIKDREHIHLNGTRWTSLTEFARWLGEEGLVDVEDSERGVMITYIDKDPETLRRQKLEAKRILQAKEDALKRHREIQAQREATKRVYERLAKEAPVAKPIPIVRIEAAEVVGSPAAEPRFEKGHVELHSEPSASEIGHSSIDCDRPDDQKTPSTVERPVFGIQAMSLSTATATSSYKPPKKRLVHKGHEVKKKLRPS